MKESLRIWALCQWLRSGNRETEGWGDQKRTADHGRATVVRSWIVVASNQRIMWCLVIQKNHNGYGPWLYLCIVCTKCQALVGLEFCPCILVCLTSVPSWCCYFPRVRVLSKLHKLQPALDDSAEQLLSFGKGSFFQWLLHILHTHPYHDSTPSNHSTDFSWGVVGKQKSGNYCCWRQYFAGCWPKANSWPLLTNTEVSLSPSRVLKEFKHFGDFNCSVFLWQQLCDAGKQPFILFPLSTPVSTLCEWIQACKRYNTRSWYLPQNILIFPLKQVAYHLEGAHL